MAKLIRDEFIELMTTDNRQPEQRMEDRILRRVKDKYCRRYNQIVENTLRFRTLDYFILSRSTRWLFLVLRSLGLTRNLHFRMLSEFSLSKRSENFCWWYAKRQPQIIKWIDYQEQHCLSALSWSDDGPFRYNFGTPTNWQDVYVDPTKEGQND